ncbi:MAG TPA: methyltransferase [Alphaproteobacteria bacterium]|nr:methyltransferase [Alphaproteobacteria bacterium]
MTYRIVGKAVAVIAVLAAPLLVSSAQAAGEQAVEGADPALVAVVNGPQRTEAKKARDKYRHPIETLTFFGLKPDMTVVELWPFGGWYTEILAPYLRDHGKYYGATVAPDDKGLGRYRTAYEKELASKPELYNKVTVTNLAPGKADIAPPGTADMVLTFRNIHNWDRAGMTEAVFKEAYKALKPGGIFGVVEHRANPGKEDQEPGYVSEDRATKQIEAAGFRLVAKSEINANPKDTKNYPSGVWTLPPNFRLGDKDREKYAAIGESDRFTLKFVKVAD